MQAVPVSLTENAFQLSTGQLFSLASMQTVSKAEDILSLGLAMDVEFIGV